MCNGIFSKILLALSIIAILISSIVLIVFGSIGLADPRSMFRMMARNDGIEYLNNLIRTDYLLYGVSIFMVTLGSMLVLQSIVGFVGVCKSTKASLTIFWISLVLAICTELGLISYAAIYPQHMAFQVQNDLHNSLYGYKTETIDPNTGAIVFSTDYRSNSWQNLQSKARCCGAGNDFYNGYKDYKSMNLDYQFVYTVYNNNNNVTTTYKSEIPPSCCCTYYSQDLNNVDQIYNVAGCFGTYGYENNYSYFWQNSCWIEVESMIYKYNYISIFTCCGLITAQLLAFSLTMRIWIASKKNKETN